MEQLDYNILFRWFVGLEMDQMRQVEMTPHVTQNTAQPGGSTLDGRTTRHAGYTVSQQARLGSNAPLRGSRQLPECER